MERIEKLTLRTKRGEWIGYVLLHYDDADRWGRLYSITDYGNYSYEWTAVPNVGFVRFLIQADSGYMTGKLGQGHDERRVFDAENAKLNILDYINGEWNDNDPDYIGDAISSLMDCQIIEDFRSWKENYSDEVNDEDMSELTACECFGDQLISYQKNVIPILESTLSEMLERGEIE